VRSSQVAYPWRATVRTAVAAGVAAIPLVVVVLSGLHLDGTVWGAWLISATTGMTRLMAVPQVNDWIRRWVPWLSPQPASADGPRHAAPE
jgi:hypothetical protein